MFASVILKYFLFHNKIQKPFYLSRICVAYVKDPLLSTLYITMYNVFDCWNGEFSSVDSRRISRVTSLPFSRNVVIFV